MQCRGRLLFAGAEHILILLPSAFSSELRRSVTGIHDPSSSERNLHVDPVGVLDVQTGIGVVFGARATLCHIAGSGFLRETRYPNREVIDHAGRALMVEGDQRPGGAEANNSE